MLNKDMADTLKNVLNTLGDLEIKAKYSKIYSNCFQAIAVVIQELEKKGDINNGSVTNN